MNPLNYIYAFAVAAVLAYIATLHIEINGLKSDKKDLGDKLIVARSQSVIYTSSITTQNEEIDKLKVELSFRIKELKEWKIKPPTIKYKVIYRDVIKDSNLTGECEDVQELINNTSIVNLNSL
jgi:hypothetical protein